MKTINRNCESNQEPNATREPHPWLQKHYQQKRERTVRLVKASVDQLVKEGQTVTIEAICRRSSELDSEGKGVKKSAVLENLEAHAYYRQHSTSYKAAQAGKRKGHPIVSAVGSLRIDSNRNVERTRSRYMQMTKPLVVVPQYGLEDVKPLVPRAHLIIPIGFNSADLHVERIRQLAEPSVIAVVSVSLGFLKTAISLLAAAVGRKHTLCQILLPQDDLTALRGADIIFCDSVAIREVKSPRAVHYHVVAPASLEYLASAAASYQCS